MQKMKLLSAPSSPYGKKVRLLLHETHINDMVEIIDTPVYSSDEIRQSNPLGRIPALILEDDQTIFFDSNVICEYLDSLHSQDSLYPTDPKEKAVTLTIHAIAAGMMDAALIIRGQERRNEQLSADLPEDWYMKRQWEAISHGLQALEDNVAHFINKLDIATIATASILDFFDLRFPNFPWREQTPQLAAWYEDFAKRPSMRETKLHI